MSSDFSPELRDELLDDFYAECDEHLGNIRVQLGRIEQALAAGTTNGAALESLYRSVHSFKGICAIAGLRVGEELAHEAEGMLRALSVGAFSLTGTEVELLGAVTHRLEQITTAHRMKQPLPDAADLLHGLHPYGTVARPSAGSPAPGPAPATPAATTGTAGRIAWKATFAPAAELDQRGVNITTVRARLAALGEILSATPSILPGGKMSFEFSLALREPPTDLAEWAADGVVLRPSDTPLAPVKTSEAEPVGGGASSLFITPSHIVRVDLSRLDELMRIAGEMVIHRSRLEERIAKISGDRTPLQEVNLAFTRSLRELREAITRVRMVSVAEIFSRMPFVVRDLARETGKEVRLVLEGQQTEIDKYLVERLKEPLLHLVRNAVSHGIETPAERSGAGKPTEATLLLSASTAGDSVLIQIRDDGRGVDAERVTKRAAAAGLPVPDTLDSAGLLALICTPGFSTRDEADRASGRGVGMAVVANTVRELGGALTLETTTGAWTKFTLRLPLTLSIAETFIVSAGGQTCAVPQGFVSEIVQIDSADIRLINQNEVAPHRAGLLPLVRMRSLFGIEPSSKQQLTVLVITTERGSTGFVVDRVHGQREVVVRTMHDPLIRVPGISGATELGDGRPVLILDAAAVTSGAVRPAAARSEASPANLSAQASS